MPNYRRWREEGGVVFLTAVTHGRRGFLTEDTARGFLRAAFRDVRVRLPFRIDAIVLMPDHFHTLMRLPQGDCDYSRRMQKIKRNFTEASLAAGEQEGPATPSRRRQRVRGVWQKRFWEHTIRDYRDFVRHVDYIHYNPVKHGLAARPRDWPWSSFHRYVRMGWYDIDWCGTADLPGGADLEPDEW